jgi:hypothetical protein
MKTLPETGSPIHHAAPECSPFGSDLRPDSDNGHSFKHPFLIENFKFKAKETPPPLSFVTNTFDIISCWQDLKVCDDGTLIQILCFWTLSIVLSLSKNAALFIYQNTTFRGERGSVVG